MSKLGALHLTKHTGSKHTATVIYLHGSGASGEMMKEWVTLMSKNFSFPHIKVMYPTAPVQPYTPAGNEPRNVWFDRYDLSISVPENKDSLANIEGHIKNIIQDENEGGIPSERIIVGGFSMGGSLSFHTAYRWDRKLAGAFVFGSFLNDNSMVYNELENASGVRLPPLLQIHGDSDDVVPVSWAQKTFERLKTVGIDGEFHVMERLGHSINKRGMELIRHWINKHLPEI